MYDWLLCGEAGVSSAIMYVCISLLVSRKVVLGSDMIYINYLCSHREKLVFPFVLLAGLLLTLSEPLLRQKTGFSTALRKEFYYDFHALKSLIRTAHALFAKRRAVRLIYLWMTRL